MSEITIELLKRVIRTIEDDAQHEWLVDEINDYLNEIDLTEALPDKLVNESGCITISLEQVEAYITSLNGEHDEWWMPEYDLYGTGLISFLRDVDRGFGDVADAILKLHAIEADEIIKKQKSEQRVADDAYRAIGKAPIKIEGERCIL
jgi:hypothetical protein